MLLLGDFKYYLLLLSLPALDLIHHLPLGLRPGSDRLFFHPLPDAPRLTQPGE